MRRCSTLAASAEVHQCSPLSVLATVGLGCAGTRSVGFSCTAMPFTLCDVPSPLSVSSRRSMLFGRLCFATCYCIHNVLAKRLQETLYFWGYTANAVRVLILASALSSQHFTNTSRVFCRLVYLFVFWQNMHSASYVLEVLGIARPVLAGWLSSGQPLPIFSF